jgi:serine/threonine protein kinase
MQQRLDSRPDEKEVLTIFGQVCAGLVPLHANDPPIIHRDIKVSDGVGLTLFPWTKSFTCCPPPTTTTVTVTLPFDTELLNPKLFASHTAQQPENVLIVKGRYKLCDFGSCTTSAVIPGESASIVDIEEEIQSKTTPSYVAHPGQH